MKLQIDVYDDPKEIIAQLNNAVAHYNASYEQDGLDTVIGLIIREGELDKAIIDKIRAYNALATSELPYKHWNIFANVVNALYDGFFNPEYMQIPSEEELVFTGWIIYRDFKDKIPLMTQEVKQYITTTWGKYYGYAVPHPVLTPYWLDDKMLIGAVFDLLTFLEKDEQLISKIEPYATEIVEGQALRLLPFSKMLNKYGYSYEWIPHILEYTKTLSKNTQWTTI